MKLTRLRTGPDEPADEDRAAVRTPAGFTLVGYGRADLIDGPAQDTFTIDAHGMCLPNGTAVTVCETGECTPHIRVWESPEAAADDHGSTIIWQ